MMALDAGDQNAGSLLRGVELFMKGQLDPAANQFNVVLRNPADAPLAWFYLGACYAAAGRDKEAVTAWERARAAKAPLPGLQLVLADGWLRLGQPAQAIEPLRVTLQREPQNDDDQTQSCGCAVPARPAREAYPTITPYLEKNPADVDALDGRAVCALSGAHRG